MVHTGTCGDRLQRILVGYLPILTWMPKYKKSDLLYDAVSGITVALTLMPQSIAYASLAGLDPLFGLYAACFGSVMYIIFGSVRQITIGPTSVIALLTFNYVNPALPATAVILCFVSGMVELVCGLFRLGFVVEFVSMPVTGGFISAAALLMASSQLKGLFGISFHAKNCLEMWIKLVENIEHFRIADTAMGLTCIFVLIGLKRLKCIKVNAKGMKAKSYSVLLFLLNTGSNVLVVIVSSTIAYFSIRQGQSPLVLTGTIASGIPQFRFLFLDYENEDEKFTFLEGLSRLWPGAIVVPLVSILSTVSVAKAFSGGRVVDASQEMIALGFCNIFGSFMGSMPVAASMSRSALNHTTGVRTTLSSIFTTILVMLSLFFLTPLLHYIPKSSLSAVLICAVTSMFRYDMAILLWKTNRRDLIPFTITFISCLILDVEMGLLVGICVDLLCVLYRSARPSISIEKETNSGHVKWVVRPSSGLLFPAVDYMRQRIIAEMSSSERPNKPNLIIVDCVHFDKTDFTATQGIKSLMNELKSESCQLELMNAKECVADILETTLNIKILSMVPLQDSIKKLNFIQPDLNGIESLTFHEMKMKDICEHKA
ncbi:sodium-independent sulfate anion transporter [Acyrthosiphon pisum]|uniref:STAS domain-containing protein n=1 Tax=Acyrthosiphon pisum TaxID=7029 RepID=A0A8R2D3T5_ACYPI|nr:sodium-independent sulfate anion transporter [Acyrthosiphon pisum]XP_008183245.1 sodium-independent sulfate anion transporter [Acyrthosiphon pisum]XP_016659979.1 sodium-independent sulfate anion transporter [Acyrthosiphon pisum]XP_016659980.1 sodium-independent sulfate anion transporter [Acyrthosiphon pisum]XP_029343709.1 sodium-independent sulfate anion transporter [Acyrthosiphon pisum]XP_029343711.1 sodium-independent sulfate anion transporter [Acyrthosiphon pisum]XP_029343712.1 sodium-i|eukprot:XP_001949549.1 PREDICTED: sodium-independent sulfate anion transporter [Acyrthosiphon pisum]